MLAFFAAFFFAASDSCPLFRFLVGSGVASTSSVSSVGASACGVAVSARAAASTGVGVAISFACSAARARCPYVSLICCAEMLFAARKSVSADCLCQMERVSSAP